MLQLSLIRAGRSVLSQHVKYMLAASGVINLGRRAIASYQRVSSSQLIAKWQGLLQPHSNGAQGQSSSSDDHLPTEQLRQLCQDAIHGEHDPTAGSACMCIDMCASQTPH
jgi:hypothetical protein